MVPCIIANQFISYIVVHREQCSYDESTFWHMQNLLQMQSDSTHT